MASLTPAEKKLDKVFSLYIRKKYTQKGYGKCYTCKRIIPFEDADAGHYINRNHKATRWDERNVKLQCRSCNRFQSGMSDEFAIALQEEYGEGVLRDLNQVKWHPYKINDLQIKQMITDYQSKLNELT